MSSLSRKTGKCRVVEIKLPVGQWRNQENKQSLKISDWKYHEQPEFSSPHPREAVHSCLPLQPPQSGIWLLVSTGPCAHAAYIINENKNKFLNNKKKRQGGGGGGFEKPKGGKKEERGLARCLSRWRCCCDWWLTTWLPSPKLCEGGGRATPLTCPLASTQNCVCPHTMHVHTHNNNKWCSKKES